MPTSGILVSDYLRAVHRNFCLYDKALRLGKTHQFRVILGLRHDGRCYNPEMLKQHIIRLQSTHPNHIWAIDLVRDKLSNGRSYRMLTVLDECTREALCVAVQPKMNAHDVLDALHLLFMKHGKPEFIRSDNGPKFIATHL